MSLSSILMNLFGGGKEKEKKTSINTNEDSIKAVEETAEEIIHWLEDKSGILEDEDEEEEKPDIPPFKPKYNREILLAWIEQHRDDEDDEDIEEEEEEFDEDDYSDIWDDEDEPEDAEYIEHKGTPHDGPIPHSGRYPYGSGKVAYQHESWFKGFGKDPYDLAKEYEGDFGKYVSDLKKSGLSYPQIAEGMKISTKDLKARITLNKQEQMLAAKAEVNRILASNPTITKTEIGRIMGINESQVRAILKDDYGKKGDKLQQLVDSLEQRVNEKGYVDVGEGAEQWISVANSRLESAVNILKEKGYSVQTVHVKQAANDLQNTTIKVLAKPGETKGSIWKHYDEIAPIVDVEIDESGKGRLGLKYDPVSVDSSRIYVRYPDEGGSDMDGLIELRRGVEDISLGNSKYAQVRIAVDGTHYMKGIAAYSDDIPPGYDIVYNTNRKRGTPLKLSDPDAKAVYKPMKVNPETGEVDMDNPFGATIKAGKAGQRTYIDPVTGEEKVSCINIVNDQGDWAEWKKSISSQFLSKQPVMVARKQLKTAVDAKQAELDSIMSISNPVVRKHFLEQFAEKCDSDAVDLDGASFPRQASHVLIPLPTIKDDECYCPRLNHGEKVVLVRYPFAGTFEAPLLTVNNRNKKGIDMIGPDSRDAVGISHKVAEQLSGADFDGDTVLVIPNNDGSIRTRKAIQELVDFEPKDAYPGTKLLGQRQHHQQMGLVSNLITDMTLQGAPIEDIVKAAKHSMVVVDSKKHKVNVEKSFIDNEIARLYKTYLGKANGGSSTIVSRASGQKHIPERVNYQYVTDPKTGSKKKQYIDPVTGEKLYSETGAVRKVWDISVDPETGKRVYKDTGKIKPVMQETTKMAYELSTSHDARNLMSSEKGFPIEVAYADFANSLHAIANKARLAYNSITMPRVNLEAKKVYSKEVESLNKKLADSQQNAVLERQAQLFAYSTVEAKKRIYPELNYTKNDPAAADKLKKIRNQAITSARNRFKTERQEIDITPREWEAIEAGAYSHTNLSKLLLKANPDKIRQLALPKANRGLTSSQERLIKSMSRRGYSLSDIANQMGISTTTVSNVINGKISGK